MEPSTTQTQDMSRKRRIVQFMVRELHASSQSGHTAYGYDLWIADHAHEQMLLWRCAVELLRAEPSPAGSGGGFGRHVMTFGESPEAKLAREISPIVFDLLWRLCLDGVLRPGVRELGGQAVPQGQGYSLTTYGKEWLRRHTEQEVTDLLRRF